MIQTFQRMTRVRSTDSAASKLCKSVSAGGGSTIMEALRGSTSASSKVVCMRERKKKSEHGDVELSICKHKLHLVKHT